MKPPSMPAHIAARRTIESWNGATGAQWVADQALVEATLAPFGQAALDCAGPLQGKRVIDVGCGCGETTRALAVAVGPAGSVLGVDISDPMLARARAQVSNPNVEFLRADAAMHAFRGDADLVFSRFGVMFFDSPLRAFANLRQALVGDGRLVFACWRRLVENVWMTAWAPLQKRAIDTVMAITTPSLGSLCSTN